MMITSAYIAAQYLLLQNSPLFYLERKYLHTNDTYFAWYDASLRTLKEKLPPALDRYEAKYGKKANFVMVNPIIPAEDRELCAIELGIVFEESGYVAPNTLYLTRKEKIVK